MRPPAFAFLALAIHGVPLSAQPPSFDVVSIKPVAAPPVGKIPVEPGCAPGGSYHAPARGVASSIRFAYRLQRYQLTQIPTWAQKNDAIFDIDARPSAAVSENECRAMVQAMLADRFKLVFHRETRPLAVIELTVAKSGSRLKPQTDADQGNVVIINGIPGFGGEQGWTMEQLADFAQRFFPGDVVVDRTGLAGSFRIKIDFEIRPGATPGDDFESAIVSELGLRFVRTKEPTEVVVIDHLERAPVN